MDEPRPEPNPDAFPDDYILWVRRPLIKGGVWLGDGLWHLMRERYKSYCHRLKLSRKARMDSLIARDIIEIDEHDLPSAGEVCRKCLKEALHILPAIITVKRTGRWS